VTFISANRECLAVAVNPSLHSRDQRQGTLIVVAELAHLEDVVGTNLDAIFFAFAAGAIDYRCKQTRSLFAFGV
jgi:hypothetical protein